MLLDWLLVGLGILSIFITAVILIYAIFVVIPEKNRKRKETENDKRK